MNAVTLKKDGSINYNEKKVESDALNFLSFQITLEEGYTLRSFFEMLDIYASFVKLNDFFPSFTAQYRACPKYGCICETIDSLEFGKTIEMMGFPDKRLEIYTSFLGVHDTETLEIKSLQMDKLLDLPLKLGNLKHVVFGDRVDIFEFDTVITLFEFIDGIAWQLGFHGTPEQCELRR